MTADIDPTQSAPLRAVLPSLASASPAGASSGQFGAELVQAQQAAAIRDSAIPPQPPAELAAHIAAAARAWEALSAGGRQVSFSESADGRVVVELHDDQGETATLSGTSLFDLIDGEAH